MEIAGKTANALDIPVILDPVGVGATSYRTEQVKELLSKVTFQIIRGNASEILSLMGGDTVTRGVDSGNFRLAMQSWLHERQMN